MTQVQHALFFAHMSPPIPLQREGESSIVINYERCPIDSDTFEIGSTQANGVGITTFSAALETASAILPDNPIQDSLTTVFRDCNAEWYVSSYHVDIMYIYYLTRILSDCHTITGL
jgi:hypothetical protein